MPSETSTSQDLQEYASDPIVQQRRDEAIRAALQAAEENMAINLGEIPTEQRRKEIAVEIAVDWILEVDPLFGRLWSRDQLIELATAHLGERDN